MALVAILSFVPAHVFSSPIVKGVAIGITQSFQFFGLHTLCLQNIWPQTPVGELEPESWRYQSDCSGHMTDDEYMHLVMSIYMYSDEVIESAIS